MKLGFAAMQKFISKLLPSSENIHGSNFPFLNSLFNILEGNAKQKGKRKSLGKTHPHRDVVEYKRSKLAGSNSKKIQFPKSEKLSDGRHRYFVANGQLIDRLVS